MRNSLFRITFGPLLVSSTPDIQVLRVKTVVSLTEIYTIAELVVQILCQFNPFVVTAFSPKFYSFFHNLCIIE